MNISWMSDSPKRINLMSQRFEEKTAHNIINHSKQHLDSTIQEINTIIGEPGMEWEEQDSGLSMVIRICDNRCYAKIPVINADTVSCYLEAASQSGHAPEMTTVI